MDQKKQGPAVSLPLLALSSQWSSPLITTTNDTTTTAEMLQETPTKRRQIDIYIAPDCKGDILSEVPHVAIGPKGQPHLTVLPRMYDGEIGEQVEATASLPMSGLMLVRTKVGAYLMRQSDYEANLPKRSRAELDREDFHDRTDGIVVGVMATFEPTGTAAFLWDVRNRLVLGGDRYGREQALGYAHVPGWLDRLS